MAARYLNPEESMMAVPYVNRDEDFAALSGDTPETAERPGRNDAAVRDDQPVRTFRAVEQLARKAGCQLDVWDQSLAAEVNGDVLLVVTSSTADVESAVEAITRHVERGGLVIFCGDAGLDTSVALGQLVPVEFGPEVLCASDDPIVGHRKGVAQGICFDRVFDVSVDGALSVRGGTPVLVIDGKVLGVLSRRKFGAVVVLGDADVFTDANIARAQNSEFFLGLIRDVGTVEIDTIAVLDSVPFGPGPKAWPTILEIDLSSERHALTCAAAAIASACEDVTSSRGVIQARSRIAALGPEALRAMAAIRGQGWRPAGLLLKNVPFQEPGPTPLRPRCETTGFNAALAILISVALGEPVGYRQESGGGVLQGVVPTPADTDRQKSTSSAVELLSHTEQAFHRFRPVALCLHCVRGDPAGKARTLVASVPAAMSDLSLGDLTILSEPRYRTSPDESFVGPTIELPRRLS
jgi:hypothetical protein